MGRKPAANDDRDVNDRDKDPGQLWWVDDEGAWHFVDPQSSEPYVRCPIDGSREQEGFAFRHLGFAKVKTAESRLSVQYDVNNVAPRAVDSVLNYLDGRVEPKPVDLKFFYEGWNAETQASQTAALDRIDQTLAYRGVRLLNTVMLQRHDLREIGSSCSLIREGYRAWQISGGRLTLGSDDPYDPLMAEMVVGLPQDGGQLILAYVGPQSPAAKVFGTEWAAKVAGQANLPDRDYDTKVNRSYYGIFESGEPRFDHIRALIRLNDADPIWITYQRLIAPTVLEDGSPAFATLTKLTEDVSVKFMGGAA